MTDVTRRAGMGLLASLAAACSPLATFNTLAPRDGGARRVARDVAFMDGPRGMLDVYAPRDPGRQPPPVVVFFYGGSWNSGRRQDYAFVGHAIASRGFVCVIPDYRLVPDNPYPDFLHDGALAMAWVQANVAAHGGDPRRIVLAGHSAGAYNAMMLALDPSWLRGARVDRSAIRGVSGLSGPYDFYPWDGPVSRATFSHWPSPEETQPVFHASADDPPVQLIHGDRDTLVNVRNLRSLERRLRAVGGQVETIVYPGVDHPGTLLALSTPLRGRAPVLDDFTTFARRVTQSAASAMTAAR